ncbi:UNVERIFIED_CONTAM: Mitogen-activated protein kinase kinase kinase NPK1 [Sesamum radiatum]|uniref:Mitogen-activated protein kinase kinase kinase NPK1 n=1 Tax=Sesamum radiatum TaxID=300843 RepID=A0AAW2QJ67_SESRA
MQDFIGSVRRSLVFKPSGEEPAGFGGFVEKIGSSIRKSRIGLFAKPPVHALPPIVTPQRNPVKAARMMEEEPPLPPMEEADVGEEAGVVADRNDVMTASKAGEKRIQEEEGGFTAAANPVEEGGVDWVAISANSASKKTQEYIRELEKEVNLLKNLSHPNIVRYLGTAREDDSLNILLEFVPGGSISSLLGKFGSFPESVIRMYTKQLLIGLEYLHKNKIMHRDIKGANILVDNKACIKLADFGASKKVEALATVTGAKSMKGTPYWMAPEVIVQSGHS